MIVIPMAGLSSRFTKQGYDKPKYMLPLNGSTVFDYSVNSFRSVFETEAFLFICLARPGLDAFLEQRLSKMNLRDYRIVMLDKATEGQADTVAQGLRSVAVADDCPVTIFNIDTFNIRGFKPYGERYPDAAGVLEVFEGSGDNWSFVEPDKDIPNRVVRTAEKIAISNLCCTGMYHFDRCDDYMEAFETECRVRQAPELYIAPIYNHLIKGGKTIRYDLVKKEDIIFCGVPSEYEALRDESNPLSAKLKTTKVS